MLVSRWTCGHRNGRGGLWLICVTGHIERRISTARINRSGSAGGGGSSSSTDTLSSCSSLHRGSTANSRRFLNITTKFMLVGLHLGIKVAGRLGNESIKHWSPAHLQTRLRLRQQRAFHAPDVINNNNNNLRLFNCRHNAQLSYYCNNIRHAGRDTTAATQGSTIYRRVKPAKLLPHTAHSD